MRVMLAVLAVAVAACGMPMPAGDAGGSDAAGGGTLAGSYRGTGTTRGAADAGAAGYVVTVRAAGAGLVLETADDPSGGTGATGAQCSITLTDAGGGRAMGAGGLCNACDVTAATLTVSAAGHAVLDATLSCGGAPDALHVEADRR